MMSFAEKPEMIQPSGSANFSMFKEAEFRFTLKERVAKEECSDTELFSMFFYTRHFNILRVMNGLASIVFAN
jgi:hypothetical protein